MAGLWREICPLAARFRYYESSNDRLRLMRMSQPKSFFRIFTESGPLIVLAVAVALLVGIVGPASAQFFNFGGPPRPQPQSPPQRGFGGGWFGGDLFPPFQQQAPKGLENFPTAPPPEKRDTIPERNLRVLGGG